MIIPKTEYVESTPASRPSPATYQDVINTIKELESQSKEKVSELESKLQAVTTENESLKASLSAKERDRALYYEKYQTVSKELEEIKAVLQAKEEAENRKRAENQIVPVINLDCTNSDYTTSEPPSDDSQATMLFTHPALSLDAPSQQEATDNAEPEFQLQNPGRQSETRAEAEPSGQFIEEIIQEELTNQQRPTTSGLINLTASNENVREEIISTDALPETPTPRRCRRKRSLLEVLEALDSDEPAPKRTVTQQLTPSQFACSVGLYCDNERFPTIEQYRQHITDVHPERRFHCSVCPFTTKGKQNFTLHASSHRESALAPFVGECKLCDIPLSATYFKRHYNRYHCGC